MNNKGFTLVELLAVMVILISISLVTVANVTSSLTRREEKECKEQKELAISAAKIYFSLSGNNSVSIGELNGGASPDYTDYFKNDKKIDRLSANDVITFDNTKYVYSASEDSCVVNDEVQIYTINFNANGGSGAPSSQTKYHDTTLILSTTSPTRSGYAFAGWSTSSTATSATYSAGGSYTANEAVTLYAVWEMSKVTIKYNVNGGTITSSTTGSTGTVYNWSTDSDGNILLNDNLLTTTILYGEQTSSDGLNNYNNSGYINITKDGYSTLSGEEWICESGCTTANKTFNQKTVYSASDFCDLTNGDCTVIVKVNWKQIYTVSYNANGGSGAPSSQTKYHYTTLTLSTTSPTRSGYVFAGWSTSSTATSATYSAGGSYTANVAVTLYAVWKQITTTSETYMQVDLTNQFGYDAGYILVYYSTSYNPVTNQTTISLPSNWNNLRLSGNKNTTGTFNATITITATDSGRAATSTVSYTHTANGGYSVVWSNPSPSSVTVQHSNTVGSKSVTIACSARYVYDYTATGSGSVTITPGTYSG